MPHRAVLTVRRPVGVAGLIASFNTPLPNAAWKVFPAIFCGNAAVFKPSEHVPASAALFAEIAQDCGLPAGVLNIVQGLGGEAGVALVAHPDVDLVSFTGSAETGRSVNETAGRRLAKVCLELGGKNALVVCDDADLDEAVRWAIASAFSNAGQRCAAASRIVVFDAVYERFRDRFLEAAAALAADPVISDPARERILAAVAEAASSGASGSTDPAGSCPPRFSRTSDPRTRSRVPSSSARWRCSFASTTSRRRSLSSTTRPTA
jgi:aldehyde dehydrogenase (NAD+)